MMDIFTKLAFDHIVNPKLAHYEVGGDSPLIGGGNDLRPLDPGAPPATSKVDTQGQATDLMMERHRDTMLGELSRGFDNFIPSVKDFRDTIGQLMSAKIDSISGSTAASQALMRYRG